MKNDNEKYCVHCGEVIDAKAEICPKCGVRQPTAYANSENFSSCQRPVYHTDERWLTVLLLSIFLGELGVHRFYVGKIGTGILQLVTLGGCGIWWLIDVIMVVTNNFTDDEGRKIHS